MKRNNYFSLDKKTISSYTNSTMKQNESNSNPGREGNSPTGKLHGTLRSGAIYKIGLVAPSFQTGNVGSKTDGSGDLNSRRGTLLPINKKQKIRRPSMHDMHTLRNGVKHSESFPLTKSQAFMLIVIFLMAFIGVLTLVCQIVVGCKRVNDQGGMKAQTVAKVDWMQEAYGGQR